MHSIFITNPNARKKEGGLLSNFFFHKQKTLTRIFHFVLKVRYGQVWGRQYELTEIALET